MGISWAKFLVGAKILPLVLEVDGGGE